MKYSIALFLVLFASGSNVFATSYYDTPVVCSEIIDQTNKYHYPDQYDVTSRLGGQFKVLGSGIESDGQVLQFACVGKWKKIENAKIGIYTPSDDCQLVCPVVFDREKRASGAGIFAIRLDRYRVPSDDEAVLLLKKYLKRYRRFAGPEYQDGTHYFLFHKKTHMISKSAIHRFDWNWSVDAQHVKNSTFNNYLSFLDRNGNQLVTGWCGETQSSDVEGFVELRIAE